MLNTWSDQALRNAQPVLMVVSCLCLCLGSCFPSSEPLNRISATQSNTPAMSSSLSSSTSSSSSRRETVQDVVAITVLPSTVSNIVFNVNSDARVRNMDHVVQERLASVGQIASSTTTTSAAGTIERNSTREGDNSIHSLSSSSSSSSSNGDRDRQRRPKVKRKKSMREQTSSHLAQKYKSRAPKRRRLPSERKGKTREELGLDARAGRRNRRTQRFDCAKLKKRGSLIRQLENSLSFFLAVYPDGTVNGTTNRSDFHSKLIHKHFFVCIFSSLWSGGLKGDEGVGWLGGYEKSTVGHWARWNSKLTRI